MKPTPLTDEQILQNISPELWHHIEGSRKVQALTEGRAISAARDAQWEEMLSKQEPVAKIVARQYEDGTPAGNTIEWHGRNAENDLPVGTKLYAALKPAPIVQDQMELRVCFDDGFMVEWDGCIVDGTYYLYAAPKPAQQEPVKFLANGTRFKTSEFPCGVCINGLPKELAGRWVALVAAEDNCHLDAHAAPQPAQPKAEPVNQMLLEALKSTRELVEHWAGYASDYFRKKHNIDVDIARIDAAIAAAEGETK